MRTLRRWLKGAALNAPVGMICCAILLIISGCGRGRIPTYAVSGTVNVDARPADGAIIIFCPATAGTELESVRPAGKTDAAGKFQLTTFEPGDGAPAGEFKVLVKWPAATPAGDDRERRPGSANKGPDRLKGKYYSQESTPLTATIQKGTNNLPPFELKSK
jgi:hypothetical protein